jgi:hypothetical protein
MRTDRLRSLTKRRLMLALALVAVALIPLAALGVAKLQNEPSKPVSTPSVVKQGDSSPRLQDGRAPGTTPDVVKEGEWSGHRWRLSAYPTGEGLCFSMTPAGPNASGYGEATSCATFVGVPRMAETEATSEMTISALAGAPSDELPAYIAGPVIDKASTVEIKFATGEVLRLPTFSGPASLGRVRFYAAQLPATIPMPVPGQRIEEERSFIDIDTLAGLDSDGNVVACLAPRTAVNGLSPLSDCQS